MKTTRKMNWIVQLMVTLGMLAALCLGVMGQAGLALVAGIAVLAVICLHR